ncbi:hypothetical protein QEH59_18250 [Coraliomargarita sp. SDUM461004]|mgnify:FL=1|uniref:Uncharacterized protein n=1 Tax=Thalassobacterium sedimentorum TaxID=3041258 RepID=A0ABU1ANK4_9BACT|nr:hypothetical protein [Coraliomargarita sp. SDUM461004]|tara:strand:- start:1935 stop:2249 length:315 start_codon:yes stop_codon:yes gene_type:complete
MNEQNIAVWILAGGGVILGLLGAIAGTYTEFRKQKTKDAKKLYCLLVSVYVLILSGHLWLTFTASIRLSILSSVLFIFVSIYFVRAFRNLERMRVDPAGSGQPM